jgi:hypothetical protein
MRRQMTVTLDKGKHDLNLQEIVATAIPRWEIALNQDVRFLSIAPIYMIGQIGTVIEKRLVVRLKQSTGRFCKDTLVVISEDCVEPVSPGES